MPGRLGRTPTGARGRAARTAIVLALTGLLAVAGVAATADAKKKKKKKSTAVTKSASVSLAAGTSASGSASCTGKTHMTGGGLAIAPSFTPPASGLRSVAAGNNSAGRKTWSSAAGAFNNPPSFGTMTTYVRCESNTAGQLVNTISTTATLSPSEGSTATLNCAPGTHVISGGYSGTGIVNFANPANGYRIVVLVNRRTGPRTWSVFAFNSSLANTAGTVTAYATCEKDAKGKSVSEAASPLATVALNQRSAADASCAGKTHVISGGFSVTPNGEGAVPGVTVDETYPTGKKGWHVGLFNLSNPPAGSALQAFAYCKK